MGNEQDKLFTECRAMTSGFRFDDQVDKVFPDMIARAVPGYELIVPTIGMLARRYAQPGIAQKRDAHEDVLLPETEAAHFERFRQAGFSQPRRWFQCFSFASYIVFK